MPSDPRPQPGPGPAPAQAGSVDPSARQSAGSLRSGQGFPASARLLRPEEFTATLRGRRVARAQWLELYTPKIASDATARPVGARLGIVVAKRLAPRAVTRNTIKRVVRDAFRRCRAGLPDADFTVRLQTRIPAASLNVIRAQVHADMAILLDAASARVRGPGPGRPRPAP